jgi:hypothetical protein
MPAVVREPSAADPAARFELLQKARRQYDQGAITDAWESVSGLTHAELATAHGVGSRVGRDHAETAARLARRLGMHPLGTELAAQLASSHKSEPKSHPPRARDRRPGRRRAQQRRDRAATHSVGAHSGESRQPHPAQARSHIAYRGCQLVHQPATPLIATSPLGVAVAIDHLRENTRERSHAEVAFGTSSWDTKASNSQSRKRSRDQPATTTRRW